MSSFTDRIKPYVDAEIRLALGAEAQGHFDTAFRHLEHAHVLGQRSTVQHVRAHWVMFRMALRNGWTQEAAGQAWRVAAAALFTPLGLVPEGNTGSASVEALRSMPIPANLLRIINATK